MLHASSLSQVIAFELLNQWGMKGFLEHVDFIEDFYRQRRDKMEKAAQEHLSGICEWSIPDGG